MKVGKKAIWVLALAAACSHAGESEERGAGEVVAPMEAAKSAGGNGDRELARAGGRDASKITMTEGPKGKRFHLGGAFATAMRARVADNGAIETECRDAHQEDAPHQEDAHQEHATAGAEVRR
jgi:hypothetical protein